MRQLTIKLKTGHIDEVEKVITEQQSLGWKYVKLLPEDKDVLPTQIIFERSEISPD